MTTVLIRACCYCPKKNKVSALVMRLQESLYDNYIHLVYPHLKMVIAIAT